MLAYHYATALDLARAAGQADQAAPWRRPRGGFLPWPGNERSASTPPRRSPIFNGRSPLPAEGHPDRAEALARFAEAAYHAGQTSRREALEEAIPSSRAWRPPKQAHAMGTLSFVLFRLGDSRWAELPSEALALLEPIRPTPPWSGRSPRLLAWGLQGRHEAAISLPSVRSHSLMNSAWDAQREPWAIAARHAPTTETRSESRTCARRSPSPR